MNRPPIPHDRLAQLSEALSDSGDDLHTTLEVLLDDLTAAVPGFCGLVLSIPTAADPVTITLATAEPARASLALPLNLFTELPAGSELVLYATTAHAFLDLADDTRSTYGLGSQVVLDGHLPGPPPSRLLVTGAERTTIDQAIGVLIAQGRTPEEATAELVRQAAATGTTPHHIAERILQHLQPLDPDPSPS